MANTVEVIIQQTGKGNAIGAASKELSGLQGVAQSVTGKIAGVGTAIAQIGGAAILGGVAAVTTGVVGIGVASVDIASQMRQSQNDIVASLGMTEEAAAALGDVAVGVFKNNFGGSIQEATAVVIEARKQLGALSDNELQDAAENALRLADTFGTDVTESLSAARTLTEEFGLSQQEAFDFITAGYQRGLDSSGDFLASIGEYSTQFAEGGASAGEFFSLMESGLSGGMLGTDKAADAFKEFRVRIQDGSKLTADSLAMIGINAEELAAQMADGSLTAADAFQMVIEKLKGVDDQNVLMQAGVGLLGTQFEDLGTDASLSLSLIGTSLEDLSGATDKLDAQYNNFGSMFEGVKRRVLVAIAPIGDKLLELANQVIPGVEVAFSWFEAVLPAILEDAYAGLSSVIELVRLLATGEFRGGILGMTSNQLRFFLDLRDLVLSEVIPALAQWGNWFIKEGIPAIVEFATPILQQLIPGLIQLATWAGQLGAAILPVLATATQFVIDNFDIIGPILAAVGIAILALTSPITLVVAALVTLATAWANNWGGIQEKTQAVWEVITGAVQAGMELIMAVIGPALEYIQGWWQAHGDNLLQVAQFVWNAIRVVVSKYLDIVWSGIQRITAIIAAAWEIWGDDLLNIATLAWESIKTIITMTLDNIGFIIDAAAALIRGDWDAFGDALINIWRNTWESNKQLMSNAKEALGSLVSGLADTVKAIWGSFTDFLKEKWNAAWESIKNTFKSISSSITDAIQDMMDKIKDLIDSLSNFELPDILTPGSPTPMEMGLRGITDSLRELNAETLRSPLMGGGSQRQTTTNYYFNQTVNTRADQSTVISDFRTMQMLLGV